MNRRTNGFASLLPHYSSDGRVAGLIGLLIGDALGVPYEFHPPEELPSRDLIEMDPPTGFHRAHEGVQSGTHSDDGAQALALLDSLMACGTMNLNDFAARLLRWYDEGYMAVDGDVFDVGNTTYDALCRLREGVSPRESGSSDERSAGNGSLMRVLPLALWHSGSDVELVRDAVLQSMPTHRHPRSLVACSFYVLVARGYLHRLDDPWAWADRRLGAVYQCWLDERERKAYLRELDILRNFLNTGQPRGTGYVLDCLATVRASMQGKSFEDAVKTAILFGHDTDTSAAIAGGLAGCRDGLSDVPVRWLDQLRGFELVEPLIMKFMDQRMGREAG